MEFSPDHQSISVIITSFFCDQKYPRQSVMKTSITNQTFDIIIHSSDI